MGRIKYTDAYDVDEKVAEIIDVLEFSFIKKENVHCIRSIGTSSRSIIARIHALSKAWQKVLYDEAHYIIEVISEKYDRASNDEKEKILIHELLHIPKCFGGGLKPHKGHITERKVNRLHCLFCEKKSEQQAKNKESEAAKLDFSGDSF